MRLFEVSSILRGITKLTLRPSSKSERQGYPMLSALQWRVPYVYQMPAGGVPLEPPVSRELVPLLDYLPSIPALNGLVLLYSTRLLTAAGV